MPAPNDEQRSAMIAIKRRCRRSVLAAVAGLNPNSRRAEESLVVEAFPGLPGWSGAATVLLYHSAFSDEIHTAPLLSMAYDAGKRVILPRVDRSEWRLRLHAVKDPQRELVRGVLGIPEPLDCLPSVAPDEIDWALIPGVAFDELGYRLGRGAGHYDRLLPAMRGDCPCWAVCLSVQLVPRLPVEPHDIPLEGVTTPHRTVRGVGRAGLSLKSHTPAADRSMHGGP